MGASFNPTPNPHRHANFTEQQQKVVKEFTKPDDFDIGYHKFQDAKGVSSQQVTSQEGVVNVYKQVVKSRWGYTCVVKSKGSNNEDVTLTTIKLPFYLTAKQAEKLAESILTRIKDSVQTGKSSLKEMKFEEGSTTHISTALGKGKLPRFLQKKLANNINGCFDKATNLTRPIISQEIKDLGIQLDSLQAARVLKKKELEDAKNPEYIGPSRETLHAELEKLNERIDTATTAYIRSKDASRPAPLAPLVNKGISSASNQVSSTPSPLSQKVGSGTRDTSPDADLDTNDIPPPPSTSPDADLDPDDIPPPDPDRDTDDLPLPPPPPPLKTI